MDRVLEFWERERESQAKLFPEMHFVEPEGAQK